MPLDSQRVDRIHARLLARYGSRWVNMWAAVDPAMVKADWAYFLDGVTDAGLTWALEHLDDEAPPTVGQFRTLCLKMPEKAQPALVYERASDDIAQRALAALAKSTTTAGCDLKAWARSLRERAAKGEPLTQYQRDAYREALNGGRPAA